MLELSRGVAAVDGLAVMTIGAVLGLDVGARLGMRLAALRGGVVGLVEGLVVCRLVFGGKTCDKLSDRSNRLNLSRIHTNPSLAVQVRLDTYHLISDRIYMMLDFRSKCVCPAQIDKVRCRHDVLYRLL